MKAYKWFERVRQEFSGEQYTQWLLASYASKPLEGATLQTGDLLLLYTLSPFEPESDNWNQLFMVVRDPSPKLRMAYSLDDSESLFVLEADIDSQNREGIRLVALDKQVADFRQLFGKDFALLHRRLHLPDRRKSEQTHFKALEKWLLALKGLYYSRQAEALTRDIIRQARILRNRRVFSAQLIAVAYQYMGLIRKEELSRYLKADWIQRLRRRWELTKLRLLHGAELGLAKRLTFASA